MKPGPHSDVYLLVHKRLAQAGIEYDDAKDGLLVLQIHDLLEEHRYTREHTPVAMAVAICTGCGASLEIPEEDYRGPSAHRGECCPMYKITLGPLPNAVWTDGLGNSIAPPGVVYSPGLREW